MSTNDIRKKFLDFFASKNHAIIASDSLVPKDDPTVLFTTAGMQQFKHQFLGQIGSFTRAATSQKCLRTDDLDKVGKTNFHHTFFEMLGNFSFGDYFKKEAIAWAWEFLTKEMKIPAERLWVSVYEEDAEAEKAWLHDIKIPAQRLVRLGDKSNFWPAEAKTKGPCGPCSEIFYDYGPQAGCGKKDCSPACDCGRFSEIWNLVFTQFNRKEDGTLEPLPNKNIDTGMGLERLAAVIQGKANNFETDLFELIFESIKKHIYGGSEPLWVGEGALVIADHIRAIAFGICDGIIPSNKERGYVIKKLINNSSDLALRWGTGKSAIHKLVSSVIDTMKCPYPELVQKKDYIEEIIRKTEEDFERVRIRIIPETIHRIQSITKSNMTKQEYEDRVGEICFRAYDTYGLTEPTIQKIVSDIVGTQSQANVMNKLTRLKKVQQERSRAASKMTGDVFADAQLNLSNAPKTEFVGYKNELENTGRILKIFIDSEEVDEAKEGDRIQIVLDTTPFYAESGGQVGDTGMITKNDSIIRVDGTKKIADVFIHFGIVEKGNFRRRDEIRAVIDKTRRLSIMRNHTATHLLHSALRKTLGNHIQQQGSFVAEDRLRFDFTHPHAVGKEQLNKVEALINDYIRANDKIEKHDMPIQEAKKSGALAFFAEKYGDTVRVVSISDYSSEFCGGTHLENTGQIGSFKITSESAIAQGIRRIEAVTGAYVDNWLKGKEEEEQVRQESLRQKQLDKEQSEMNFEKIKNSIDDIIKESKNIGAITVIRHHLRNVDLELLRKVSDLIKQKVRSAVIILACENNGNANILIVVTDDLVKRNIKANELIKKIAPLIGGSGGGRAQLAQAGSKDPSGLENALKKIESLLEEGT